MGCDGRQSHNLHTFKQLTFLYAKVFKVDFANIFSDANNKYVIICFTWQFQRLSGKTFLLILKYSTEDYRLVTDRYFF